MNPLQYSVYKGVKGKFGAVQFNLQLPHFYCPECKSKTFQAPNSLQHKSDCSLHGEQPKVREGAIFLEITSTKEPNVYDWDKKIKMALSVNDMGKVLLTLVTGNDLDLRHDPGAGSDRAKEVMKYLNITSPEGTSKGVMIRATQQEGEGTRTHTVPLSADEVLCLRSLFQAAIARSLGW